MKELVYVSKAVGRVSADQVRALLEKARSNNQTHSVTGVLFFNGTHFLQLIEGPEDGIETVFAKIEADPMHDDIMVFYEGAMSERSFSDWRMGYKLIDNVDAESDWEALQTAVRDTSSDKTMGVRLASLLNQSFITD